VYVSILFTRWLIIIIFFKSCLTYLFHCGYICTWGGSYGFMNEPVRGSRWTGEVVMVLIIQSQLRHSRNYFSLGLCLRVRSTKCKRSLWLGKNNIFQAEFNYVSPWNRTKPKNIFCKQNNEMRGRQKNILENTTLAGMTEAEYIYFWPGLWIVWPQSAKRNRSVQSPLCGFIKVQSTCKNKRDDLACQTHFQSRGCRL